MNKQKYIIYLSSIFMSIVVTMFISSVVTFKSLDDLNLFWDIWSIAILKLFVNHNVLTKEERQIEDKGGDS